MPTGGVPTGGLPPRGIPIGGLQAGGFSGAGAQPSGLGVNPSVPGGAAGSSGSRPFAWLNDQGSASPGGATAQPVPPQGGDLARAQLQGFQGLHLNTAVLPDGNLAFG